MLYEAKGTQIVIGENFADSETSASIIKLANSRLLLQYISIDYSRNSLSTYYQLLDAEGRIVSEGRLVGQGYYETAQFAAQPDGGYLIAKTSRVGVDTVVGFERFDADGVAVSSGTAINLGSNEPYDLRVTSLEGGGWVMSWWEQPISGGGGSTAALHLQAYDHIGQAMGDPVTVSSSLSNGYTYGYFDYAVTALDGGGFALTFGASGPQLQDAGNWIYSAQGERIGETPELVDLAKEAGEGSLSFATAARADGGMLFVRRVAGDIVVEQLDGAGQRDHQATVIETDVAVDPDNVAYLRVTVLEGGGFVVTWTGFQYVSGYVGSTGLFAQSFDADGHAIGGVVVVDAAGPAYIGEYDIVALSNGGFVISWDHRVAPDEVDVVARVFDSAGQASTDTFLLHPATPLDQIRPELTALDDGRFMAFWTDGSHRPDSVIRGQVFSSADERIEGTIGADSMAGGVGDDVYVVNHPGDIVIELQNEGTDTVEASLDYTLPDNVENLTFVQLVSGAKGHGNALSNVISADNAFSRFPTSPLFATELYGEAGDDNLIGSQYNDLLNGGPGTDRMEGGRGNDSYFVDDIHDVIIEYADGGVDQVQTDVNFTLPDNVENIFLTGTGDAWAWGNALGNKIYGNDSANVLWGLGGNDEMHGEDGDDWFLPGDWLLRNTGNDIVDGGDGFDSLAPSGRSTSYSILEAGGWTYVIGEEGATRSRSVDRVAFLDVSYGSDDLSSALQPFDGLRYIASNPDLIVAIGNDAERAVDHYERYGFAEGRRAMAFEPYAYLASNADLVAVFGTDARTATEHYIRYGYGEGRSDELFDGLQYAASYDDLAAAFGTDAEAAARHYLQWGRFEGRSPDAFDGLRYIASNPDLIVALGDDDDAAARHYIHYARVEDRPTDSFDALAYAAANPDLAAVFGTDVDALTRHYIDFGFYEHRDLGTSTTAAEMIVA